MTNTIDILKAIIAGIVSPVVVGSIGAVVGGVFPVVSSDTSWLYFNQELIIENNNYQVVALEQNVGFSLKQIEHTEVITGSFNIPPPTFFYGTWLAVNNERDDIPLYKDKTPFIWLFEVREEQIELDPKSSIDREADLRLLFMGEANFGDWLTEDHYDKVINPLSVLVREFLASVRSSRYISKALTGQMRTKNHANAGSVDETGHLRSLFNDELSGIEAALNLPINKCNN